jgi:hypothetical protein
MAEDFLAREQALLGGSFSPTGANGVSGGAIDFDVAASAFPELDDFDGQAPIAQAAPSSLSNGLGDGFGDFESVPSFNAPLSTDVKLTGDDELEKFENQFPDLDVVCVDCLPLMVDLLICLTPNRASNPRNKPTNHPSSLSLNPALHSKLLYMSHKKRNPRSFGRPLTPF